MRRTRFRAAALAAALAVGLCRPASAVKAVSEEEAAQVVGALNIMVGDSSGSLNLGRNVTRAEFITMAVKASPQGDQVGEAATSPYPDVPRRHWAAGYVEAGVRSGLISGYLDGTFRPDNTITLAEGVTVALKLLGYSGSDFSGAFPTAQMAMYRSLGLDTNLAGRTASSVMTRRDCMYLFYNLLSVKNKAGQPYLNTLGYSLNAAGEVDRVALLGQVMEGPILADGNAWRSQIPFDLAGVSVYRANTPSSLDSIRDGDLIYWNEGMRRLWVYRDRITGTVQSVSPSPSNPTAVVVAGHSYPIETDAAAYALSDLGGFRQGDTVTLVLGRTGGAAAVLAPNPGEGNKIGIVTAVSRDQYTDANGRPYTADTVTLQGIDGQTYRYETGARVYSVGDVVQMTADADGKAALKRVQKNSLSGRVSADGAMLGNYPLARDVEILDTYEDVGVRVFPSRLAGVHLTKEMVHYYSLNPQGEIQQLILNDATGDMHRYGIVTSVQDLSSYMNVMVNYTMDLSGQTVVLSGTTKYPVDAGPCVIKGDPSDPDVFTQLKSTAVDRISENVVIAGSQSFAVLDSTLVYEYRDGRYYLSNLDRLNDGAHTLTAWYDKAPSQGGGVRVIIGKTK